MLSESRFRVNIFNRPLYFIDFPYNHLVNGPRNLSAQMLLPYFNRIGNFLKIVRSATVDHSNRSGLKAIGEFACNSKFVEIISVTQFGDKFDYVVAIAPGIQPVHRRARKR